MNQVLAFASLQDPDFLGRIRGASEDEIARIERAWGRSLPASYRSFLDRMGHGTGGIVVPGVDLDVGRVLRVYEGARTPPPSRYLLIGVQDEHPYLDVFLDCGAEGEEPRVVRAERGGDPAEAEWTFAYRSLAEMLLCAAFRALRLRTLPFRLEGGPSGKAPDPSLGPTRAEALDVVAARLGFTRLPGTSLTASCYDRPDAALLGYAPEAWIFGLSVGASDATTLARLHEVLAENVGVALVPDEQASA